MQNDFQPDFTLTPYSRENKLSQYLQPHEEVLWECHAPTYPRIFWQIVLAELILIIISSVIFDSILKFVVFTILFLSEFVVTLTAYKYCFKDATHYILTHNRFLTLYFEDSASFNPKKRKVEDIDFSQVLELKLTKTSIKIISPTVPFSKITPQRDVQWLYDKLLQRWERARQWASQSDVLTLKQMYRPPMKRYLLYVLVCGLILFPLCLFFFSPYLFGWPMAIFYISVILVNGYNFVTKMKNSSLKTTSWLQTLIMGKDYRNVKHAPVYRWLNTVSLLIPMSVVGLLLLFFRH